jgi:protein-S-isoprenylcysteine O-methyltransferase Ste14
MQKTLLIAVLVYFFLALLVPTVRAWRRFGVFPVVLHRETGAVQLAVGALFGLSLAALQVWSVACALIAPARLGIWQAPLWVGLLGWLLYLIGLLITLIAQTQMGEPWRIGIDDRPTALVSEGLFLRCRNPIFTGMLISMFGMVLIAPAVWSAIGALLAMLLISIQVRFEELHLLRLHGAAYTAYAARVGRFVPGAGRLEIDTIRPTLREERS